MFFQFSPPARPRIRKESVKPEDEVSVISLAPFTTCPKILFEDIQVGVKATRKLSFKNPASVITNIHVAKVPEVPSGQIELSWLQTELDACGEVLLHLSWTPTEPGSCRNSLVITNDRLKLTREIFCIFRAIDVNKRKSPTRKGIRKTTKSTFGVSIRKIRKSLSPKKPKNPVANATTQSLMNRRKTNYCSSSKENFPMNKDQFSVQVNVSPDKKTVGYSLHCNILTPKNVPRISFEDSSTFTVKNGEKNYDTFLSDSLEQNGSTPDFAARLNSDSFLFSPNNRDIDSAINRLQFTPTRLINNKSYQINQPSKDATFELPKPCLVLNNSLSPISTSTVMSNSCNISTSTQISNYDANYSGREAKNIIEANLWTDSTFDISPKHKLSCIREESEYSDRCLKRKAETITSSIPSKMSLLDPKWNKVNISKLNQMIREPKSAPVKTFNPNLIIKKMRRPDAFSAAITVDPFLSGNLYYDEEWLLKQEVEFKRWLNALLTPPTELECNASNMIKVDVAKLFTETRNKDITPAPSKEVVSSLYHTNAKLNYLRQKAINLFRSPNFSKVICKVFGVIDKKKILISKDKNIHLDITLQAEIIQIITCYNPLWLRIGLETIYGETIKMKNNMDVVSLSTFILLRFFADPYLKRKFGIVNVRRSYHPSYAPEIKKFIVKKFVTLIYFLDQAKQIKLIPHDPCLFCVNAPIKESKQILLEFSKLLLSGVGDITKYFKIADYILNYKQNILDEFPYAINHLGKDLRDGIRLTKVMEIILQRNDLTSQMRAPAISRLQKIHNVKVALEALKSAGFDLTGNIEAKDIVDGHQEKTLSLLWQIIYKFRAPLFKEAAYKILCWWNSLRIVIARKILARKRLEIKTAAAIIVIQKWWRVTQLARVQRKLYLQNKFHTERRIAANKIKYFIKACLQMKKQRADYLKTRQQVIKIQSVIRKYLTQKRYRKLKQSTLMLQKRYRANVAMKYNRNQFENLKFYTIRIQSKWRAIKVRRTFLKLRIAVITLQNHLRSYQLMIKERESYRRVLRFTKIVQQRFRAQKVMKSQHAIFQSLKYYTIRTQAQWRMIQARRVFLKQRNACIVLQTHFQSYILMKKARQSYLTVVRVTRIVQQRIRALQVMKYQRLAFQNLKYYTIRIQAHWRMIQARREFLKQMSACVALQNKYRSYLIMKKQRELYRFILRSVRFIQIKFRATIAMKIVRNDFLKLKASVVKIQKRFRATRQMRLVRTNYEKKLNAVRLLQKFWIGYKQMKYCRGVYLQLKEENSRKQKASAKIQALWRGYFTRKNQSNRLNMILQRSVEAAMNVESNNTIGFRFKSSVESLFEEKTTLKTLIQGLTIIDELARIYPLICGPYLEQLYNRLFVVLNSSNQSEPFRQACTLCSTIILSIIEYRKLQQQFFVLIDQENAVTLVNLMQIWCDKKCQLFLNLSTIVQTMLQNDKLHNIFANSSTIQRLLLNIHKKVKRMQSMHMNLNSSNSSKSFLTPTSKRSTLDAGNHRSSNVFLTPKSRRTTSFKYKSPAAVIKTNSIFTDELIAITSILKICNIIS